MNRVPELAARLEKRPGKVEAFDIIRKARVDIPLSERELSVLYGFFLPPPPKKVKSVFDWLTLACDTKSSYSFCKNLLVDRGMTIAANPKQAHIVCADLLNGSGWYDTRGGKVGDDVAIMPDVNKAMMSAMSGINLGTLDLESLSIRDTPTGLSYVLPWVDLGVNKTYFDAMYGAVSEASITGNPKGSFAVTGVVQDTHVIAVVMPFKLPPV